MLLITFAFYSEDNANSLGEEGAVSALLVLCGTGGDDMVMAKSLKSLERLISQSGE